MPRNSARQQTIRFVLALLLSFGLGAVLSFSLIRSQESKAHAMGARGSLAEMCFLREAKEYNELPATETNPTIRLMRKELLRLAEINYDMDVRSKLWKAKFPDGAEFECPDYIREEIDQSGDFFETLLQNQASRVELEQDELLNRPSQAVLTGYLDARSTMGSYHELIAQALAYRSSILGGASHKPSVEIASKEERAKSETKSKGKPEPSGGPEALLAIIRKEQEYLRSKDASEEEFGKALFRYAVTVKKLRELAESYDHLELPGVQEVSTENLEIIIDRAAKLVEASKGTNRDRSRELSSQINSLTHVSNEIDILKTKSEPREMDEPEDFPRTPQE